MRARRIALPRERERERACRQRANAIKGCRDFLPFLLPLAPQRRGRRQGPCVLYYTIPFSVPPESPQTLDSARDKIALLVKLTANRCRRLNNRYSCCSAASISTSQPETKQRQGQCARNNVARADRRDGRWKMRMKSYFHFVFSGQRKRVSHEMVPRAAQLRVAI